MMIKNSGKVNSKMEDISELCSVASEYYKSDYNFNTDVVSIVKEYMSKEIPDIMDRIREELEDENRFKKSSDRRIMKTLIRNYHLLNLYKFKYSAEKYIYQLELENMECRWR